MVIYHLSSHVKLRTKQRCERTAQLLLPMNRNRTATGDDQMTGEWGSWTTKPKPIWYASRSLHSGAYMQR